MTPRIVARLLVFLAATTYLVAGPAWRQLLGGRSKIVRNWVMFSGANLDLCEATFHLADDPTPLDRYRLLGVDPWYTGKTSIRRLTSVDDIWHQGRSLCTALGPGTDLRAEARCARRSGWRREMRGDVDLCRRRPAPPTAPSKAGEAD